MGLDFNLVRQRIADAARRAFDGVRAGHPDESFYAFALYTVDDAVGVNPAANTEQGYARKRGRYAAEKSFTAAGLLGNFRWAPYEWEYECHGAEYFRTLDELLGHGGERYDKDDPLGFVNFKTGVFASMVLALSDLEFEGHFGVGPDRDTVTVFCSVPNSGCTPWLEEDSARRLNPSGPLDTFVEERIEYIREGSDDFPPTGNSLFSSYLSHLRKGGCRV